MSGGGGGPTSSTVTQSTIPEEFYPQLQGLLNAAGQELFSTYVDENGVTQIGGPKPFQAYSSATYKGPSGKESVAQMSGPQLQAFGLANWLGSRQGYDAAGNPRGGMDLIDLMYGRAGDFAQQAGYGGQNIIAQSLGYTDPQTGDYVPGFAQQGAASGKAGENIGVTGGSVYGNLGAGYGAQATELAPSAAGLGALYQGMITSDPNDPNSAMAQYMSPYMKAVVEQQQQGAIRQAGIAGQQQEAAAARAGAFGGARQAIQRAEADRALQSQLQGIEAQGLQQAYQQAQANILNRAQLESQGIGQAGQMYGLGMQGAGLGLQGVGTQLAGTAQGMQGAGVGLQGVQAGLGGYGLMGQMGGQLADITGSRLGQYGNVIQTAFGLGEQERQLRQQEINQQILNYQMAQQYPMQNLQQYNALLRGFVVPGQTVTQYQANAPIGAQLAGLGTAGLGLAGMMGGAGKKAGGTVSAGDGIDRLALRKALAGE